MSVFLKKLFKKKYTLPRHKKRTDIKTLELNVPSSEDNTENGKIRVIFEEYYHAAKEFL